MMNLVGYEDSPFNSLFGELDGDGIFQETGVKATPYPQNEATTGDLFQELDQLAENTFDDWLTEKVDFNLLAFQDDGGLLLSSELTLPLDELSPTSPVISEIEDLQEFAVGAADLELLNSLVVDCEVPPQPVSPGENTAPHLLALSPTSSAPASPVTILPSQDDTEISSLMPAATLLGCLIQQRLQEQEQSNSSFSSCSSSLLSSPTLSPTPSVIEEEIISNHPESTPKRSRSKLKTASGTKYNRSVDKKSRKRDQNKAAATRYREKKKTEADSFQDIQDDLLEKNKTLNEQVDSLTREIKYMKELMVDVYKAKGMI